ncbi:hypothetical protein SEA_BRYNNIE_39 [Arthrobacter phage Brynnie]|nr:hypothetical protein SEA_BRYNNIE_39 [Arthrobacter phage Brynnie]
MIDAARGIFELLAALAVLSIVGAVLAVLVAAALMALAAGVFRIKQGASRK